MSNISFVFFTRNEEKRIAYAIRNCIKYGDVLVLDGGSTDRTKEISESLGAKSLFRPPSDKPQVETQENFNFIKDNIKTDWIYWGYVDNIAPKTLLEKMAEISNQDKIKMVYISLYTYLWGNTNVIAHKGYTGFFFHKDFMDFSKNYIHGMGQFTGNRDQLLKLPNKDTYALKHFSTYNINKFVSGYMWYAEAEAAEKHARGEKFSVFKTLAAMLRYCWIYRRGYRSESLGLIIALSYAFSRLMTYARLYELENNITLDSIEKNYSIAKEKMLEEFN